ncbi:hypothetical protein [Vibrio alginolyticus]|uniref:hypothetical protein n=1 Tax=Vibrio alginolyticus TaxID=663 RepID=UPI0013030C74|nr:hypothetical protein [Vibrio alginolyticus]
MNSPILELLPAIHATIIGIFAAIASAFAVWAFQKLFEAEESLKKVISEASECGSLDLSVTFGDNKNNLIDSNGLVDWDGVGKNLLRQNIALFSHLDDKATFGIAAMPSKEPTEQEILKAGDELLNLFNHFFNTYPFTGKAIINVKGVTDKGDSKVKRPFTIEQLVQIRSRVDYVCWCWQTNSLSIIELFKRYTEIKHTMETVRRERRRQIIQSQLHKYCDEFSEPKTTPNQIPSLSFQSNYLEHATHFFERAHQYQTHVLPNLTKVLNEYEAHKDYFKFEKRGLVFVRIAILVLILGVCLPLVLLEWLHNDQYFNWDSFVFNWIEHFVLLLTMSPYFYAAYLAYTKLKRMSLFSSTL